MSIKRDAITLEQVDLEVLYRKCRPFDESALYWDDPEYQALVRKLMIRERALAEQLTEKQVGQLYACIEDAQACVSFEIMHYLREGFLLGLSVQLGTVIHDLPAPQIPDLQ